MFLERLVLRVTFINLLRSDDWGQPNAKEINRRLIDNYFPDASYR